MMSMVASKIRKLSNKSSSKDRTLAPSGDNGKGSKGVGKASKDVERTLPASKSQNTSARKSLASARESTKEKGKLPEVMDVEGEEAKADGTNDSGKGSVPDYYLEPLEVLKSMFQ